MFCDEAQKNFSPLLDGDLHAGARAAIEAHLHDCPVCRMRLEEMRTLVRSFSLLSRPAPPANLVNSINDALLIERAARPKTAAHPLGMRFIRWLEPLLMPYTVGALASLILFVAIFSALRVQMSTLQILAGAAYPAPNTIWVGGEEGFDVTQPITPAGLVAKRAGFANESPSLNPRGALAALAWAPSKGYAADSDDMVVIADVYGNGQASLAEVVEPPRNRRAVSELEDALRKNPAFVPAALDRRPQAMRVIFVLQKMNVREETY